MLTQVWIDALMQSQLEESPDVIGRSEDDDKRDAWALKYIARMVEVGVPLQFAIENYQAGEHDISDDPEDAADTEMSYWDDDGA